MKKQISRKQFLQLSALTALSLSVYGCNNTKNKSEHMASSDPGSSSEINYSENLGIQVFALRDLLAENPRQVFESLADIGIKNIELFDPSTLKEYVPIINDLGMIPLATHFLPGYITGKWETAQQIGMAPPDNYQFEHIVEDCATHGIKYLGIAIMMPEERQSLDDFKRFADLANQHGEISKKSGVQLYYHNHSFEFKPTEGSIPYDEMIDILDPNYVKLELDPFWATISGNDPVSLIEKLGDQIIFLHLKDLKANTPTDYTVFDVENSAFVELGDGILDFKNIFRAAKNAGITHAFIDQDHTSLELFESVKKNYHYMQEMNV